VAEKLKHLDDSSAVYRTENARNKSKQYLEKCLQEITYLLKPPSHPPPQQQPSAVNLDSIQQAQIAALFQQQNLPQHLQHSSPSPNHQPPPPPPPTNHEVTQPYSIHSHSAQSLRGHQSSPFQADSRIQIAQPPISISSMPPRENVDKAPQQLNAYSSLKKDTNPFSAAASLDAAMGGQDTSSDDVWDFDEKIGGDNDSTSPSNPTSEEIAADYASGKHSFGRSSGANIMNSHRRRSSLSTKRRSQSDRGATGATKSDSANFKVKFAMRGHLDVVRAVVFTGGGSQSEPEICTAGDDGVLKRWYIPGNYGFTMSGVLDVDVTSHFTHRGHSGIITSLAVCPVTSIVDGTTSAGWVFSGGQDATVKVWEERKVEPRGTLIGHTDTVWAVCVLPSASAALGSSDERILLASGAADGTVKVWSITPPPNSSSQRPTSSASSSGTSSLKGSSNSNAYARFESTLLSTITRPDITASPTCIIPMSVTGESFIVSYNDSNVIIFDTASGEEVVSMASQETYDGTPATGVSSVVATTMSLESGAEEGKEEEVLVAGATGGAQGGIGGVVISGHEDQYVRIFDANSGMFSHLPSFVFV
jgi:striatin 1/3/4